MFLFISFFRYSSVDSLELFSSVMRCAAPTLTFVLFYLLQWVFCTKVKRPALRLVPLLFLLPLLTELIPAVITLSTANHAASVVRSGAAAASLLPVIGGLLGAWAAYGIYRLIKRKSSPSAKASS